MQVLKERYVKKCAKDICGSELYTLVASFCSKHNIFFKNNYKIGLLKFDKFAVTRNERHDGAILG
jgi:hypothetical protein